MVIYWQDAGGDDRSEGAGDMVGGRRIKVVVSLWGQWIVCWCCGRLGME